MLGMIGWLDNLKIRLILILVILGLWCPSEIPP